MTVDSRRSSWHEVGTHACVFPRYRSCWGASHPPMGGWTLGCAGGEWAAEAAWR